MLSYTNKVYNLEQEICKVEEELKKDLKNAILSLETNSYADKFYEFDEVLKALHLYYTKILRFENLKYKNIESIIEKMFEEEIQYAMCEEYENFRDKAIKYIKDNKKLEHQGILTYEKE